MDYNLAEISELKAKVAEIVTLLEKFKADNSALKIKLNSLIKEKELLAVNYTELEQKFNKLKTAKTISTSSKDVQEAKLRINKIVREIDKCIGMLNR